MHKPLIATALFLATVVLCASALTGNLHPRHRPHASLQAPAATALGGVTESVLAPGMSEIVFADTAAEEVTVAKGELAVLSLP